MKRTICVITGARSEYGILKPLLNVLKEDPAIELQIIATTMHLSEKFGSTYQEIERDGFVIHDKIHNLDSSDSSLGVAKSMGSGLTGVAENLERLKPDIVVGLGDRFELLSAAAATYTMRIPFAHIGGGEITEGSIDDGFRHAITKLSSLHFASTDIYRQRLIQLGEDSQKVFNVGELGLERIHDLTELSREELEEKLNIKFNIHNLLITLHPVSLQEESKSQMEVLLKALAKRMDTHFFFTKSNADAGGQSLNQLIDEFVQNNKQTAYAFTSLGSSNYLQLMRHVDAVVGNSSSGIVETPSFHIGTINIGDRQKGRLMAESTIQADGTETSIKNALVKLYSEEFQKCLTSVQNPYEGAKNSSKMITRILKEVNLDEMQTKKFCDINQDVGSLEIKP